MAPNRLTPKSLPNVGTLSHPEFGSGAASGRDPQRVFDFGAEARLVENLAKGYASLRERVDQAGGVMWLAALTETPPGDTSERLRRVCNSKGNLQRAFWDVPLYLATYDRPAAIGLACDFCDLIGDLTHPQEARTMTTEEKLRLVAGELSEKRRRELERENHLAPGSLDPGAR